MNKACYIYSAVLAVLKVPDHTTKRTGSVHERIDSLHERIDSLHERVDSLHEGVDRPHERVTVCRDALSLALVQRVGLKPECGDAALERESERADCELLVRCAEKSASAREMAQLARVAEVVGYLEIHRTYGKSQIRNRCPVQ